MKKLYKIYYTYRNTDTQDFPHHHTQYYFCYELKSALNDIESKYEPLEVNILFYEELNYTDCL